MTRTHKTKKELILQIKFVTAKDTEQKLLNGLLVENFLNFKSLYLNVFFKYLYFIFIAKRFFSVVSWLLFFFQLIQDTIPLSSGFYCFSWEVNQQSRSWYCKSISFFSPPITLKTLFLVCGFQYLHLLCPLLLLLYLLWNLFGFLNMCLLKSIITFNKFVIIESSAPFTVSHTSNTLDETYARLDCYVLCRISSVQFSRSVVSDSLWPHELQHARPPCPSPTPGVHSDSRPLSQWCHPAISSSGVPFSSCPQSLPASESFPMSQLFAWGDQSIGVSALASFLPKNTQDWSSLEWTGWISLQSKGLCH